MLHAKLRDETFARPLDFDCLGHVLRALETVPYAWPVDVLLETTLEEARRRVPPVIAMVEQTAEGVIMRGRAESLDWMARFLIGLECRFLVREPPELRDVLRSLSRDIAELAERTANLMPAEHLYVSTSHEASHTPTSVSEAPTA